MNLLLDTHVVIWWLQNSPRLGSHARKAILQSGRAAFISSVSIWEISIKSQGNTVKLREPLRKHIPELIGQGFRALPVTFEHALALQDLPAIHRDPFDRMLVAQAQSEDLTIVTSDSAIEAYDVRTMDASD